MAVEDAETAEGLLAGDSCGLVQRQNLNPEQSVCLQRRGDMVFRLDDAGPGDSAKGTFPYIEPRNNCKRQMKK